MENPLRRLTIPSGRLYNLRDLGGYACDGGVTKHKVFLRSDHLHDLTDEDIKFLLDIGLTDVIDLRSKSECEEFPNSFLCNNSATVHNITGKSLETLIKATRDITNMGDFYKVLLDELADVHIRALEVMANAKGVTIFHCLVGKDRTGIVAALLLLLLGVDEYDIIADYQVSETFLERMGTLRYMSRPGVPSYAASSSAENMRVLIDYINRKYGSAANYLMKNGLSDETVEKFKDKFVE